MRQQFKGSWSAIDAVLGVLVPPRTGFILREELELWSQAEHRLTFAKNTPRWGEAPSFMLLHQGLSRGEIPNAEAFAALKGPLDTEDVAAVLGLRHAARQGKQWAVADGIRDKLRELGVVADDSPDRVRWKLP